MMGDYTEHLISMAGGDGDEASGAAEVLHHVIHAAHCLERVHSEHCTFWHDDRESAAAAIAAGFGPVKEASQKALTEAAEEIDRLRIIGKTPYTEACAECEARAWWAFAEVRPEEWLRARAAELSKP